jgi:uncharacterized protein
MSGFFGNESESLITPVTRVEMRPLMRLVYVWMTLGLLVTAATSVWVASSPKIINAMLSNGLFIGAIIAELVLVVALSWGLRRLSPGVAIVLFFAYAAVNGFTLSLIFLVYELGTINLAFISTAAAFAVMSVVGYTTQLDLAQYRSYFIMALLGLLVAMIVNMFLASGPFDLIISMFGVVLFTALTAYDTQKIKRMAADPTIQEDGSLVVKLSIWGALQLYLDFVNLFLFLLRLMGRRR